MGRHQINRVPETIEAPRASAATAKPVILLAGEKGFVSLLKYIVENNGFNCILTEDPAEAIGLAEIEDPDVIALDDILPSGSVLAVRQKIYQNLKTRHIPVLILAGAPMQPEKLLMCLAERTTYILKPFLPDAFISRLTDLVRQSSSAANTNVLRFFDIIMEHDAHRVYRNQRCVRLSPVEYRVLQHLLEYPRKVLSREQILATVRAQSDQAAARSVDVHISRIRKALCEQGEPNYIRTVRGVGYSLDAAPDGPATYSVRPNSIRAVG
jgi:two-component system phosphate regulon response regulator PhoB